MRDSDDLANSITHADASITLIRAAVCSFSSCETSQKLFVCGLLIFFDRNATSDDVEQKYGSDELLLLLLLLLCTPRK